MSAASAAPKGAAKAKENKLKLLPGLTETPACAGQRKKHSSMRNSGDPRIQ